MQSEYRHTTHHDFRERTKLEGKHPEADEEHLSQPSTMHSLGNLEEHSSPARDTPKSSRIHHLGHQVKHGGHVQTGGIRAMLRRIFAEKVDTARDNDQKTKEAVKKVNQEILQLPKSNERLIESVGKGYGKEISSHRFSGHSFGKISEIRDQVARYMPQVREGAHLFASVARSHLGELIDNFLSSFNWADSVSPSTDLSPKIKEQLNKVNEDIRKLPRRNERVIESMGQARSEEKSKKEERLGLQPKSKPDEQELWDMAFHKIEELKEKAHQKGQEFKHEAEKTSQKGFGRSEESGQQKPQGAPEHQDLQHHEHHHLSAQSRSFQSTEHGRELCQTVKEGLKDSSVPLSKKVEEVESHWKQEEGQGSLKQGAQGLKSKISEKAGEIKQSIQGEQQNEREPLIDKIINSFHAVSDNIHHTLEDLRDSFKVEERPHDYEPLLDKVMDGINKISENVRHRKPSYEQQVGENPGEKDIGSMLIRNLAGEQVEEITFTLYEDHSVKERIQERIHRISDKVRGKSQDKPEEITFTLYEDHTIKEKIQEGIHHFSDKVRGKGEGKPEEITFTLYEDHSIKEKIQGGIHHISDKVRGKGEGKPEEIIFTLYEDNSIKGKIQGGIHNIANKIRKLSGEKKEELQGKPEHDIELKQKLSDIRTQALNLKDLIAQKHPEDVPEGYHKVATGFSETVKDHLHKTRYIGPLKSRNPFEALGAEAFEFGEPQDITEVLPPFDLSISQSLYAVPHRIKESLARGIDEIKSKLMGRHKKTFEEKHQLVPMEVVEDEEEYEEEPQFEDDSPSKGKIRQKLEEFSSKISHDIEVVKGKFKSKKEALPQVQEKKETLKEKVVEIKPVSQKIQGIETIKQQNVGLQQAKHKKKKVKTPKSASKAYPSENVASKKKGPSFKGFHEIVSGFSQSVSEFQRELRGPPLVSSNPFGGLVAGGVPRRKVSFQEPQQQKKKVYRVSQSAGKEAKRKRFEDFHKIKTGFSESVAHFQREVRGDPLISDNPFEPLSTRNVNLIQPLDHSLVVGGHLDELIAGVTSKTFDFPEKQAKKKSEGSAKKAKKMPGTDITNKIVGESHVKALIHKTKGEIHDASNKISGKIHAAKGKIKSVFHAEDKENVALTA